MDRRRRCPCGLARLFDREIAMQNENVYLRGATYWGRFFAASREYRRSLRTADEAVARTRWREEKARLEAEALDSSPTWKGAVVVWSETVLTGKLGDGLKPKVQSRYKDSVRLAGHFFADLKLRDVTKRAIAEYVRARKAGFHFREPDGVLRKIAPVTNATIRRDLTALSSVFRAAVASGIADENPARAWDRSVIKERRTVIVPPTIEEIETVASYARPTLARMIRFAAYTGVRLGEAVGIEWRDVRLDRGEVLLPRTKVSRPRTVRLSTPGGDATGSFGSGAGSPQGLIRHVSCPLVFWMGDGTRMSNASGNFARLMKRAIEQEAEKNQSLRRFRFHDLRHAFAVRWLLSGGDIYALSRHLGHTSVKTTEIYLGYLADSPDLVDRIRDRITDAGLPAQAVS